MAKAPKTTKKTTDETQAENTAKFLAGTQTADAKNADGSTGTDIAGAAKKEAAEAAAKAKAEAKAAAKLAKDAANSEKVAARKQAAEAKAAERAERIAVLQADGKKYVGSMLVLADRVKSGAYVKGTTGQLRSNDELAIALDGVGPNGVIQLAKFVLGMEENPYTKLNIGQQSMNFRNRMRGALKKGTLTMDSVKEAIATLDIDGTEVIRAKAQAKADAKAAREEAAAVKKAAKATKPEAETAETAEA
jgi:hypothetical protein